MGGLEFVGRVRDPNVPRLGCFLPTMSLVRCAGGFESYAKDCSCRRELRGLDS